MKRVLWLKTRLAGSMLLAPELADGSYFDAQGQEYENATNFLDKSNPIPEESRGSARSTQQDANALLDSLDDSAQKLIETQNRCRKGRC